MTKKLKIPGLNRALGITKVKRKISKLTGIPTTKSGRKRKVKNMFWNLLFPWWK